jgi:exosortase
MHNNKLNKTGILFFLFILAYLPTWQWMGERWFERDSYYSHGILIPFLTALLIWQKRHVLKKIKIKPSPWGLRLFITGIIIHFLSLLFRVYFTSGFSMIIVLAGFVLCVYGEEMLKEILFPVIFLIFMVPLPLVTVINISFQLKLLSAQMATGLLNLINIPAVQQGSYIRMAHATVVVEDVCSGLRSLIALMALGALFAYWMKSGKLKKTILFFSSIPIALITNMFRIMALAIISECWGPRYITGFVESFFGFLVFALAFLLLSRVEKLLK